MADEEYGGKVVWFMAGIAIGATVALLYAPASGEADAAQDREEDATRAGMRWPIPAARCWIAARRCTSAGASWRMKRRICSSAAARSSRAPRPI